MQTKRSVLTMLSLAAACTLTLRVGGQDRPTTGPTTQPTVIDVAAASTAPAGAPAVPTTAPASAVTASAVKVAPATTGPTAAAAVSTTGDAERLIKQLGDDDSNKRDEAQARLITLGPSVMDAVSRAARDNDDPEVRSRANTVLAQIKEHLGFDASLVTLHLKDASVDDALAAIARQGQCQITGAVPGMGVVLRGAPNRTVTLDVDQKPFWEVMTQACQQLGLCPALEIPTHKTLKLYPITRNWLTDCPHQVVGPFWVGVGRIARMRSIDMMGPTQVDDQFYLRLIVEGEPKLTVTQISGIKLTEATDDAGNSLIPTGPQKANAPAAMAALLVSRLRAAQSSCTIETRLQYPDHPGKKISTFSGEIGVTVADGVQEYRIDDVLGTATVSNAPRNCQLHVNLVRTGPEMYQAVVDCVRSGMSDEEWAAISNRVSDLSLEDATGRQLTALGGGYANALSDSQFRSTITFTQNVYDNVANMGIGMKVVPNSKTGEPKKLVWNIASRLKVIPVPVMFKDLPMP